MIITMALCSPLFPQVIGQKWKKIRGRTIPALTVILHIFLEYSAKNGNEDVPIWEYFVSSHALRLLPVFFENHFRCG